MCNAWNHSASCRCGWGGEGHLGGGRSGELLASLRPSPFLLAGTSTIRNGRQCISFLTPNARCPICRAQVYFYQSPHGGRVFFDELGWPWPKHPCTDNHQHRTSTAPIISVGDDINQLALFHIHEWLGDGYVPLVCTGRKGGKQVGGQFLFTLQGPHARGVWLYLAWSVHVVRDALFFIKELDAARGEYELKFCFKERDVNRMKTEKVQASINTFIRPSLRGGRIVFRDYTGIRKAKVHDFGNGSLRIRKRRLRTREEEKPFCCDGCKVSFRSEVAFREHVSRCGRVPMKCRFCSRDIPKFDIKYHEGACRQRPEKKAARERARGAKLISRDSRKSPNEVSTFCVYCAKRSAKKNHEEVCNWFPQKCRYCSKNIPRHQLRRHEEKDCRRRPRPEIEV